MTTLHIKFIDKYIDYDSDASVFMCALLLALTCVFSDTAEMLILVLLYMHPHSVTTTMLSIIRSMKIIIFDVFSSTKRGSESVF